MYIRAVQWFSGLVLGNIRHSIKQCLKINSNDYFFKICVEIIFFSINRFVSRESFADETHQ